MLALDPRLVRVGIEVNGRLKLYEGLAISARGTKFANANQNECEVSITNLDKDTRNYLVTETSAFNKNRTPKVLTLDAGRQSYGLSRIFAGDIASAENSQPPDIVTKIKCLTGNYLKGTIVSRSQPPQASLSNIAKQVAEDLNLPLNFQATERQIASYTFTGGVLNQIDKLEEMGLVSAFIDDNVLVVKDRFSPLLNKVRVLNLQSGMIGIPEITEQGIKVKFLLDNQTVLGGMLRVQSVINPAANGDYLIYKLSFEIANRDTPFYWVAEAKRI